MGRQRRQRQKLSPSFFPFISVLITIIGILIFMTLALSVTAVNPGILIDSKVESGSIATDLRKPVVVECKNRSAFLVQNVRGKVVYGREFHPDKVWEYVTGIYRQGKANQKEAWADEPFLDFLNGSREKSRFLVFLIRPSGVYSFTLLSDIVKMRNEIKPEQGPEETGNPKKEDWNVDWSISYQEEGCKVTPPLE